MTGRHIRDQARVLKLHLQVRIKRKIAQEEPIMPWLVRWAAMLLSRFGKGKDGKTPYERQRGRKCELEIVPFGEVVWYRLPEVATDRHQLQFALATSLPSFPFPTRDSNIAAQRTSQGMIGSS